MSSNSSPIAVDDFKRITGIGPAIEHRLHEAGILTFDQLAALEPGEIVARLNDLVGMSAEHVAQMDWPGLAHKLALESASAEAYQAASPGDRQHDVSFTVKLLLNEDHTVRRTQVVNNRSKDEEDHWSGWDGNRILEFISQQAKLQLVHRLTEQEVAKTPESITLEPTPEEAAIISQFISRIVKQLSIAKPVPTVKPTLEEAAALAGLISRRLKLQGQAVEPMPILAATTEAEPVIAAPAEAVSAVALTVEPVPPPAAPTHFGGILHLRELKTMPIGSQGSRSVIREGQPFSVQLTLDLKEVVLSQADPLEYSAAVYARRLGGGSRQTIGEARQTIMPKEQLNILLDCKPLPPDNYRLEAVVTFAQPPAKPELMAHLEGGILQVY